MSIESLIMGAQMTAEFGKLSDLEIATLVLNEVWANCKIDSRESALLESAIDRLRRARGGSLEDPFMEWDEKRGRHIVKRGHLLAGGVK